MRSAGRLGRAVPKGGALAGIEIFPSWPHFARRRRWGDAWGRLLCGSFRQVGPSPGSVVSFARQAPSESGNALRAAGRFH